RAEAESAIATALETAGADVVALAGFMRVLGGPFVDRFAGRLVNVHPSLLPAWPGIEAIRRAWEAGDAMLGVTVHYVDKGMDTGPIIGNVVVARGATLEETEVAVHEAEHRLFTRITVELLDAADAQRP
ncbi:MAG: phosphoribosylglycinamide formyltransferase, partial [Spirochaetales bacterium]